MLQQLDTADTECDDRVIFLIGRLEEMLSQDGDVSFACTQWRQADGKHIEAIKQVEPKPVGVHRLLQVLVRRGDDPHLDRDVTVSTDALDGSVFQHFEQLGLQLELEVPDFVEEQGATVRQLDLALFRCSRTGERAFLVTEQFGLDQGRRNRRTVDTDERPLTAVARQMLHPGEALLAGTGLAEQQHSRSRSRDLQGLLHRLLQRRTFSQDTESGAVTLYAIAKQTVLGLELRGALLDQRLDLQDLADQGRHHLQQREVALERTLALAQPVHGQHADRLLVEDDGDSHVGDSLVRQGDPVDRSRQIGRFVIDVGNQRKLAGLHHPAGDTFTDRVIAAFPLDRAQSVGILDRENPGVLVGQQHTTAIQTKQLRQQTQHALDRRPGVGGAGDQPRRLLQHKELRLGSGFGKSVGHLLPQRH